MGRSRILQAAVAVLAACSLAAPDGAAAGSATHFAEVLSTPAPFSSPSVSARRDAVVVLQSWEAARAVELKAADPSLTVLAYQNLGAMTQGRGPQGHSSSGVNYDEALGAHPEWFLREANGAALAEEGYPYLWMADIGEPSYQAQWTANVLHLLANGPWDGVVMDDTNTSPRFHVWPQSRIAKYPTDVTYQAAVRSMLAYAGPRIQAAGKLAIPNFGSWTQYPEVVKSWLSYVSGGEDEMFAKWSAVPGEGYRSPGDWLTQQEEVRTTEAMGKRFLAITQAQPGDDRAVRFGWASALLDGNSSTSFLATSSYDAEPWSGEYEAQLGEPLAAASEIGAGAWARRFQNGLVIVNPSSASVHVALGGAYSGDGLTAATEATMGADSSLILGDAGAAGGAGLAAQSGEAAAETLGQETTAAGSGAPAQATQPQAPVATPAPPVHSWHPGTPRHRRHPRRRHRSRASAAGLRARGHRARAGRYVRAASLS